MARLLNLPNINDGCKSAGYNRRHTMKSSLRHKAQFVTVLWLLTGFVARCRASDTNDAAAADLARQIAAITGPGVISLDVRNESAIPNDELDPIRRTLRADLSNLGVTARDRTSADTSSIVRVTLSQAARQGVWVAEVQQGPEVRVAIVNVPNPLQITSSLAPMIALRKTLLLSQSDPILDAELIGLPGDPADMLHLLVLTPDQVLLYSREKPEAAWNRKQSFAITHDQPWPRDVRGRLDVGIDGLFRAYLPGVVCTALESTSAGEAALAVTCVASDDPWPIGSFKALFNSGRNYFTGVTIPNQGAGVGPFYSAAELGQKRGAITVFAELGGQTHLYDGTSLKTLAGSRDWGSDVAGVASGCGSGAQLLATASSSGDTDSLLAYEVEGRSAIPVSAPLTLDGSIVALWPASSGLASSTMATLILRRQQPLQYEAFSVSVACNQ